MLIETVMLIETSGINTMSCIVPVWWVVHGVVLAMHSEGL